MARDILRVRSEGAVLECLKSGATLISGASLRSMTDMDPELERLEKAAQAAHGRYLRLESFHDVQVVEAAHALWQSALAALDDCRARKGR